MIATLFKQLKAVTTSDTVDLPYISLGVYVSVAGTLAGVDALGESIAFPVLIAGWHPISLSRILATGTTATGIVIGR